MVTRMIEAGGVEYAYPGGVRALAGVDVTVDAGELVAVLGPNGAGKSTLLRLLAGLARPDAGTVLWDGQPVARAASRARARRIALVPQSLSALPEVAVRTFVAYGRYAHLGSFGRPRAGDRDAVDRALAEAELVDLAERPLASLSGGQRQRALIARALAQEAELVLVDEPTNALDPEHQLTVFELIAGLTCAGRAAVVVTHDLNLASQFATRAVLLADGRVAADGAIDAVLRREVLEPVYGPRLRYDAWPVAEGRRPVVLPWRSTE